MRITPMIQKLYNQSQFTNRPNRNNTLCIINFIELNTRKRAENEDNR